MAGRDALPYPQAPVGIGGWLSFFITVIIVVKPLLSAAHFSGEFQKIEEALPGIAEVESYAAFTSYAWYVIGAAALLCAAAGVLLCLRHRWDSVKFTVWVLWLTGPGLLFALGLYIAEGESWGAKLFWNPVDFASSCVFPAIWSAYLLLSKRVRNTYPRL